MATTVHHAASAIYVLPSLIEREVARVILRCAFIEHQLQQTVWHLMQIALPYGRIATRTPKAIERLDMIRDLLIMKRSR